MKLEFGNPQHIALARRQDVEECTGFVARESKIIGNKLYWNWTVATNGRFKYGKFFEESDGDNYEENCYINIIVRNSCSADIKGYERMALIEDLIEYVEI